MNININIFLYYFNVLEQITELLYQICYVCDLRQGTLVVLAIFAREGQGVTPAIWVSLSLSKNVWASKVPEGLAPLAPNPTRWLCMGRLCIVAR